MLPKKKKKKAKTKIKRTRRAQKEKIKQTTITNSQQLLLTQTRFQIESNTGVQQNGLKETTNYCEKSPFLGRNFNFFPFNFPAQPEIRVWVHLVDYRPLYQAQV